MSKIILGKHQSVDMLTDPTVAHIPNADSPKIGKNIMEPINPDIHSALQIVIDIKIDNIRAAIEGLRQLSKKSLTFSRKWLYKQALALEKGNWSILSKSFIEQDFVGKDGYFIIIAPYQVLREGTESIELTAILGRVSDRPDLLLDKSENLIQQEFGVLGHHISTILPYEQIAACGQAEGENGEAFITSNGWMIPHSVGGPSLNNMTEQRRRFYDASQKCIRRTWEPNSADLLLAPLQDLISGNYYRNLEYHLHTGVGHGSGWGLKHKIETGLFANFWNGSVEEARADGVALTIAAKILLPEEAGKVAAANMVVRLSLDAQRRGGLNRDGDVGASLINFDRSWDSGEICTKNGRLAFHEVTYPALLRASKPLRDWAMKLTHEELRLDDSQGLCRLYGSSLNIPPITEAIFLEKVVDPCKGLFPDLR
jgi:Family of unknown function (DUF6014)